MNEISQKIIDLDKKTTRMKQMYEDLLRKKKFEGQDKVQALRRKLLKEFLEEGNEAYKRTLEESDSVVDNVEKTKSSYEKYIQNTDEAYSKIKEDLVETLWGEIVANK